MPIDPQDLAARLQDTCDKDQILSALRDFIDDDPDMLDILFATIDPRLEQLADLGENPTDTKGGEAFLLYHVLFLGRIALLEFLRDRAKQQEDHPDVY